MRPRLTLIVTMAVAGVGQPAVAQTTGSVAVSGGSTTDARGIRANSLTVAPGVRVANGPRSALWLGASGTRFEADAWSAGVNAALGLRAPLAGPLALALDGAGSATATSYDATFVTGEATPALELTWRRFAAFGGVRAATGVTSIAGAGGGGVLGRLRPDESVQRTSVAPAFGASILIDGSNPRVGARVSARVDAIRTGDARVTDQTVGAAMVVHALTLSVSAGRREAALPELRDEFAQAAVSLAVTPSAALQVATGSYADDLITGAARGRYVSAGLRFTFGGTSPRPLPRPAGVQPPARGVTRLSIHAERASRVEVYGDWNGWQAQAAERAANGVWYVDLRLDPGEYRYSFRIDGAEWTVPRGAPAVDDGFGGKSAYVSVPVPARAE